METKPPSVETIFGEALDLSSASERAAYLDRTCGGDAVLRCQVESLLAAHDRAGDFLDSPNIAMSADRPHPAEGPGTIIGPYKLLQEIGEGGMGTVWMAEQTAPVKRVVALKVIKAGMDSRQVLARFGAERQALALMDHPHIARVLDAGATEQGRPYFVMELVKGVPITRFCDERRLTPKERLELFIPVCEAVQHAHQKGVIHRDIKPSNVLVSLYDDKAVPKVIDFGVAKATGQRLSEATLFTGFGTVVGTPEYMSPEQAELNQLDIDTRSDIYSLGVLLYELLTGSTPLHHRRVQEAALLEVLRLVREEEPPKPSTRLDTTEELPSIAANRNTEPRRLQGLVRGELDWIVMKALEKDRNRRYETAGSFAADVRRYLDDEPVHACPPSAWYRFRKFARRNKAALAAVMVMILAVLVAVVAMAVGTWLTARERAQKVVALEQALREHERANRNFARAKGAVEEYLVMMTESPLLRMPNFHEERKRLLASAVQFYEEFVRDQTDDPALEGVRGRAYFLLASAYDGMGERQKARANYEEARRILARVAAERPEVPRFRADLALSYNNLGNQLRDLGETSPAWEAYQKALSLQRQLLAEFPDATEYRRDLAGTYNNLGALLGALDRHHEAGDAFREAIRCLGPVVPVTTNIRCRATLASSYGNLGNQLGKIGRPEEALTAYRTALELKAKLVADDPRNPAYRDDLAMTHNNLAVLCNKLGRLDEAAAAFQEARALLEPLVAEFPAVAEFRRTLASNDLNRGNLLSRQGKLGETKDAYHQAAAHLERLVNDFPGVLEYRRYLGVTYSQLSELLHNHGPLAEAEVALKNAVRVQEGLAADYPKEPAYAVSLGGNYVNLGMVLQETERLGAALAMFDKAVATLRPVWEQHPEAANARLYLHNAYSNQADALTCLGRHRDALAAWDRAVEFSDDASRDSDRVRRVETLVKLKDYDRATAEADALAASPALEAQETYSLAVTFAWAAGAARADAETAGRYAGRAVELLRQAVRSGFTDVARLREAPALDPLRSREDFQQLLKALEEQTKP
jgi:serine/threonine protein kinase/tetratricopeptide (TPR) repeat protein